MNKQDQAQYLVNLMAIMDAKEAQGRTKGNTLTTEYNSIYNEFTEGLRKEQEDKSKGSKGE